MGPNTKKLIAHKISVDAIPAGGGAPDALRFLFDKERILATTRAATKWVQEAIAVVRTAAEPNPWKNADDEAIAGEILRLISEKRERRK